MLQIIKKMNVLLDKKQKRTMVGLIILMVISAFLQTAGVGNAGGGHADRH